MTSGQTPGTHHAQPHPVLPWDAHNQALVANVHPAGWINPTPGGRYNLVVLGAGTAGLVSAIGAAGLGAKVALVERDLMGGDCLNYGCVPSKALTRSSRAAYDAAHAATFGIWVNAGAVDFCGIMERLRRLRAGIAHNDSAKRFSEAGVDVFLGQGVFAGPDELRVGDAGLRFARAVIATGSRAASLAIPGLAEIGFLTNETVFALTALPKRLLVIGAGPIGCELAQAFRRFGSEVSIIGLEAQLLPREDADAAAVLAAQFERESIGLALGAKILRVEQQEETKVVVFERNGSQQKLEGDAILVAIGRTPNLDGLGLEAAGVEFDRDGVTVDDRLRTSNRRIYAAGDICSPYKFTHAADAMARMVVQNALFWGRKRASSLVIPWTTYTDPEIAHVGLYEKEARERGLEVQTFTVPFAELDRAVLDGETEGFARLHVEAGSGRILGATVVARHAGEMIGEVVLAITEKAKVGALSRTIHPYPTQAEAWKRLGDAYQRTRLTPGIRRFFRRLLAWRR
jgi:pyruvate/2-oxoglutarate dehydrogenase complex dihydrolipoamide dehydrogenase (E3) component